MKPLTMMLALMIIIIPAVIGAWIVLAALEHCHTHVLPWWLETCR